MTPPSESLFRKIWPPLPVWKRLDLCVLAVLVYTALVEFVATHFDLMDPTKKWIGDLGLLNAVLLSVLLGFRNLQAYDRWWEGRKMWGQLINDSRNVCLKAVALADPTPDERRRLARLVVGFAVGMKNHLRGIKTLAAVPGFEDETATPAHVPAHIAGGQMRLFVGWRRAGRISEVEFLTLDPHVKALMDVVGVCERIQSSPVPMSYRALLRHGTLLYLLSAPWFLVGEYGYWALAVVGLVAYFLLGIELTAEDVEDPFGRDGDDLQLARYCETIRTSAEQILGVKLDVGELTIGPAPQKNPPAK